MANKQDPTYGYMASSRVTMRIISPVIARYGLGHAFNHESLNPFGKVQPWSILSIADYAFTLLYKQMLNNSSYLDLDKLESYLTFFAAADISVKSKMYDEDLDKSRIDIQFTLSHVGRTSISQTYDLIIPDTETIIATGQLKTILVDAETRKPCPFPDWWREKYVKFVPENASPFVVTNAPKPPETNLSSFSSTVLPSFIDSNLHVGWYYHVKLYMDSFTNWYYKQFGFFGNGVAYRNVKYMKLLFKSEASLGEELKVEFHPVSEHENTFQFFMQNEKTAVSECFVEFYPPVMEEEYRSKL